MKTRLNWSGFVMKRICKRKKIRTKQIAQLYWIFRHLPQWQIVQLHGQCPVISSENRRLSWTRRSTQEWARVEQTLLTAKLSYFLLKTRSKTWHWKTLTIWFVICSVRFETRFCSFVVLCDLIAVRTFLRSVNRRIECNEKPKTMGTWTMTEQARKTSSAIVIASFYFK